MIKLTHRLLLFPRVTQSGYFRTRHARAFGGSVLNTSPVGSVRTHLLHQPRLLTRALVRSNRFLSPGPDGIRLAADWVSIFGGRFELRCFQLLSRPAWLPGSALSDNR